MMRLGGRSLSCATAAVLAVIPLLIVCSPPVFAQAAASAMGPGGEAFLEGAALVRDGDYEQAVRSLQQATQKDPQLEPAWHFLGVALFKLDRLAEAVPAFEKAVELAEFRPGTRFYLAQVYEMQGDFERALDLYTAEVRVRRARNADEVLVALGRTQMQTGKYRDALVSLAKALEEDPNYVEARYFRGLTFDAMDEPEAAVREFKRAKKVLDERDRLRARLQRLSVDSRREASMTEQIYAQEYARAEEFVVDRRLRPYLSKALGGAYAHSGNYGDARIQYRASMSMAEGGKQADPMAHILIGHAYLEEGYTTLVREGYVKAGAIMLDAGIAAYVKALSYDPNSSDAYVGIGRIYRLQAANYGTDSVRNITSHTFDEAVANLRKALELDPDNSEAMKYLGVTYMHQGEFQLARQQLEAGIALHPGDAELYARLSASLIGLEQYDEAVTQAETSLGIDPNNYWGLSALGMAFYYLGDLGRAIPSFERAIRVDPRHHQGYTDLGNAYFQSRSWYRARDNYEQALELIPEANLAGTLYQRAYLHYLIGRANFNATLYGPAVRAYNEALALDGSYFECILALAEAHLMAGEYRAAEDALRDALSKSPGTEEDSQVHLMRGQVFEKARRPHDATIEYGLALRADPTNVAAHRALTRLQQRVTAAQTGGN